MSDFELVSGLIDALTYVVPVLIGVVLLAAGLVRRKKGKGGSALIGVGVALVAVFGLVAAVKGVTLAVSSTSPTVVAQSPDQSDEPATTSTTAPSTTTSAPIPADPLSPTQHVWCPGTDENRARVVLTALILDLDAFPARVRSGSEAAIRGFLAGPSPTTTIDLFRNVIEGDPQASWLPASAWLRRGRGSTSGSRSVTPSSRN